METSRGAGSGAGWWRERIRRARQQTAGTARPCRRHGGQRSASCLRLLR